jgi:hypothetical protein
MKNPEMKIRVNVDAEYPMDCIAKMVELIKRCNPVQVNIGADSGNNHLPEPSRDKLLALIDELQKFTTIARKSNLGRLMGGRV